MKKITLFDNRQGAMNRTTVSDGTIHVRGNTTKIFPKKGYRFSLTQESAGGNIRSNHVSLLGMRQDDDWLLYAAYNDQEKIRNVFSSNLWKYSCGTDNAQGIDTGMKYKYLELFVSGEYHGLYALGYPIDIDNAVDIYLFINLIQGVDHAMGGKNIKNLYLSVRDGEEGLKALYSPWDMDLTWGNGFINDAQMNCVNPYGLSPSNHVFMHSGYLNQLLVNEDQGAWEKIFDKYRKLRMTGWSEETMNAMLDEYEADIYESGAYLREMERWPEGSYRDVGEGLSIFRAYVMERLAQMDLYYEELELSHDEDRTGYEQIVNGSECNNGFSMLADEAGGYEVYLDDRLCYDGILESENADIRIVLLNPDSGEVVDNAAFSYPDL